MTVTYTAVEIIKIMELVGRDQERVISYPPQARFHVVQLDNRKILRAVGEEANILKILPSEAQALENYTEKKARKEAEGCLQAALTAVNEARSFLEGTHVGEENTARFVRVARSLDALIENVRP